MSRSRARILAVGALLLAILAVFAVTLVVTSDDEEEAAPPPHSEPWHPPESTTDSGHVFRFELGQLYGKPTLEQAVALAKHNYIISGQAGKWKGLVDDMMAAHPGLLLADYQKPIQYQGSNTTHPTNWYQKRSDGSKILVYGSNVWLMNPQSPFVEWNASRIGSSVPADVNGVYLDSMGTFSYQGPPAGYTVTDWIRTVWQRTYPAVRGSTGGRTIIANGLQPQTKPYWAMADGLLDENWVKTSPTANSPATVSDALWQREVQGVIDAQSVVGTESGQPLMALGHAYLRASLTAAQDERWRQYLVASYLIANRGSLYLNVTYRNQAPWQSGEMDRAAYTGDIGESATYGTLANMRIATNGKGALYCRDYTRGYACINTSTASLPYKGANVPPQSGVVQGS